MSKKINKDIDSIIKKLKKAVPAKHTSMSEALTKALVHPAFRERDMRQEAMDMGAHGAKEYFGEKK
jgi:hypothetical protein